MDDGMEVFWFGIFIILLIGGIGVLSTVSQSCNDAKIYNQRFNTNYSCGDFILSSRIIIDYAGQGENKSFNVNIVGK